MNTEQSSDAQLAQQGYLLAALAAVQWGMTSIFGKAMFDFQADPLTVSTLRATLVLVTLVLILGLFRREWLFVRRGDRLFFFAYGLIVALGLYVYFVAIERVGATVSTLLLYTYPVFVTLLAVLFLEERLTFHKGLALALTVAGVALVADAYRPGSDGSAGLVADVDLVGILLGLLAAFLVAARSIFGKKAVAGYSNWTILLYSFGLAGLFLMAGQVLFLGPPDLDHPISFWGLLAGLAWVSTLGGNLAYVSALARIEASRASTTTAIQPVLTAVLAYAFFGETLSSVQILGALLVLAGVLIVQR